MCQSPVYLPPGGPWNGQWGVDITEWVYYDISTEWDSGELLWDGQSLNTCGGNPVQWPIMTIHLYMEPVLIDHFDPHKSKVNVLSSNDTLYVELIGSIQSNLVANRMNINPISGSLSYLTNIDKTVSPEGTVKNCPITKWEIKKGEDSNYHPMVKSKEIRTARLEANYMDFSVRISIDPIYHKSNGIFILEMELCPLSEL